MGKVGKTDMREKWRLRWERGGAEVPAESKLPEPASLLILHQAHRYLPAD